MPPTVSSLLPPALPQSSLMRVTNAVYEVYGYDFRGYSGSSLSRRIKATMGEIRSTDIDDFVAQLVQRREVFAALLRNLSINVTGLFRDPVAFRYLRQHILPVLATYPHIRIWCAGVATGEEAWSIAIMLKETGLYDKSLIYATDLNPEVLHRAFLGRVNLDRMADYSRNYLAAGGSGTLAAYYTTSEQYAHMRAALRENIVFSTHNLSTDQVFNEFHLILCRNVLIYFGDELQNRVVRLLRESLIERGYLFIGNKESLNPSNREGRYFDCVSEPNCLYRVI